MTPERIAELRKLASSKPVMWPYLEERLSECLDEIERLQSLLYPPREVMSESQTESIWGKPQP